MKFKGYICGTDIMDIELGATDVIIFPSIEALKDKRQCWDECGILELECDFRFLVPAMNIKDLVKKYENT